MTEFSDGEEVVVFLYRTPIGYWRCYGMGQGKYTVVRSADGGKRVRTNVAGLTLVTPRRANGRAAANSKLPLSRFDGVRLEDFIRAVKEAVRQ